MNKVIQTERLILRSWSEEDFEPFAKLNADKRVREFFPGVLSRQESDASIKSIIEHIQRFGWGLWAVELIQTGEFIGFIGLLEVDFKAPFNASAPAVEIGWRLGFNHWRKRVCNRRRLSCIKIWI